MFHQNAYNADLLLNTSDLNKNLHYMSDSAIFAVECIEYKMIKHEEHKHAYSWHRIQTAKTD